MAESFQCPECGGPLSERQARAGECPRCLMALAAGETGGPEGANDAGSEVQPGETIGPYTIVSSLGVGGMGEVFLAEQHEPIERRVALKVVKAGMDTRQVISRFEAERQLLALMDHAGIAKVFEAGTTPAGRPYFAMEFVEGRSITAHCDVERLTVRERLELFMKVCAAVQHAHQKGVIHRDLKPSNVLVTLQDGQPQPKVIDFGIAKATARPTDPGLVTEIGTVIGTLEYMSPEQAEISALDVDTRADVYSLGVLLYELLTGALPFDPVELHAAAIEEMRRRIRSEEPSRPSRRLQTLGDRGGESAHHRQTALPALTRAISGDLDWITLKALEKEPDRRYASPAELARDLERHLGHEPVEARPPSAPYRVRKFVRRNRLLVGSAAAVLVALVAGIAGTTTFGLREAKARADLEEVVNFQQAIVADADPQAMGERLVERLSARVEDESFEAALRSINTTDAALEFLDEELLARAATSAGEQFADQPLVEARLLRSIGWSYYKLGMLDQAAEQLERAVELYEQHGDPEARGALGAYRELGLAHWQRGRFDEAEPIFVEVLETSRRVLGEKDKQTIDTMSNLALLYHRTDRAEQAVALHREAQAFREQTVGSDNPATIGESVRLADALGTAGREGEAERLYRDAIDAYRRIGAEESENYMKALANLGASLLVQDRYDEARMAYEEALAVMRPHLGATHPLTVAALMNLGSVHLDSGDFAAADAVYREALADLEQRGLTGTPVAVTLYSNLGISAFNQKRLEQAASDLASALEGMHAMVGPRHPQAVLVQLLMEASYRESGQPEPARQAAEQLLGLAREDLSIFIDTNLKYLLALGLTSWDEDLRDHVLAREVAEAANEEGGYTNPHHLDVLAQACFRSGDAEAAVKHQRDALAKLAEDHPSRTELEERLATYEGAASAAR